MSTKLNSYRKPLRLTTIAAAGAMAVVACSAGGDLQIQDQPHAQGTATTTSSGDHSSTNAVNNSPTTQGSSERAHWVTGLDLRVELLTLARTPANAVVVRFRLTSYAKSGAFIGSYFARSTHDPSQLTGVTLIDTENRTRYLVLTDSDGNCACSRYEGFFLQMRRSVTVYAYFPAPPSGITHMAVDFPHAPIFTEVPLEELRHPAHLPMAQPEIRPSDVAAESTVLPVISRAFELDGSGALKQKGQKTKVRLSAKVLFDVGKSNLRPKAKKELRDVAHRIEAAKPDVVHIDGYTDSTAGPNINIPLSKNRAQSVKSALSRMIDGNTVKFVVEGHGAKNPIASNSTPQGRQKNRRVTVTFKH